MNQVNKESQNGKVLPVGYWGLKLLKHLGPGVEDRHFHVIDKNYNTIYLSDIIADEGIAKAAYEMITSQSELIENLDVL